MNRYSLVFALLVASSFAVHSNQAGNGTSSERTRQTNAAGRTSDQRMPSIVGQGTESPFDSSVEFVNAFLAKSESKPGATQDLKILFATVPHPIETHLAAAFDHNVDALEDGLQESGYLFDSSLIPWTVHEPREQFDDDVNEKTAKRVEDSTPGILLFRSHNPQKDPYDSGIVVFLLSEKPTQGIAVSQAVSALKILKECRIQYSGSIRILGPTFSGSFASLVPVVAALRKVNPTTEVLIRSGGVTVGDAAVTSIRTMAEQPPAVWINFGSAHHDNADWVREAVHTLKKLGIDESSIATLSEDESLYGGMYLENHEPSDLAGMWNLAFPRDISSLRVGYEQQGIFDSTAPAQPWKRYLNLKSEEQNPGDSTRTFGGSVTMAEQESILFGISEFLKTHNIRAAIISATNEEDRYFLTQFLHAHNGDVRVVVIGNTRLFMRGSTAQFRGDIMVDDFPMLPRLHDWTGTKGDHVARIFADDVAQGTYFAAIDLFAMPPDSTQWQFRWFPEYSAPNWVKGLAPVLSPPMYVTALGSNATWPVAESAGTQFIQDDPDPFLVEFPFTLFQHNAQKSLERAPLSRQIRIAFSWWMLFVIVSLLTVFYCTCFWYARPVSRTTFATWEPCSSWRFWLFKVTIPAAIAGCAFRILAYSVEIPPAALFEGDRWLRLVEVMMVLAPLAIVSSSVIKALGKVRLKWTSWMGVSFLPVGITLLSLWLPGPLGIHPISAVDVNSIFNAYREMHWESGLSLIPTGMFFLLAIWVWSSQAGNGAGILNAAPILPDILSNDRISQPGARTILSIGRPVPLSPEGQWLWAVWLAFVAALAWTHYCFRPFTDLTTLESPTTTSLVRGTAGVIGLLILLDVLQFFWLWDRLHGMLRALDNLSFRRSFVPIRDFKWRDLWSITGTSLRDRRAILSAQAECVIALRGEAGFSDPAQVLEELRAEYSKSDLSKKGSETYRFDLTKCYEKLADAGVAAAALIGNMKTATPQSGISPDAEAIQRALACQCRGDGGRFSDEAEELARLPDRYRDAERLLCLIYIGFIQTVVARLHTLLISVASMFSFVTLGVAIYPFAPFYPLLLSGLVFLALIGWAFFKIFSEMDTDPILSRIVNGDDRKLQGNFYTKFAEAIALPILALGSSILPGGAGRLLELAQTFLNQGH